MERPRRVFHDIDYKITKEIEKEKEKDNNLDPFGYNDNDFLNPVIDNYEEEPKKEPTASWLEDTDKLNLPSRIYQNNNNISKRFSGEIKSNQFHSRDKNIFDRNNNFNNERDLKEELEIEKMKCNRIQAELDKLKAKKDIINTKNILQYVHKISYDSLGLGKKIGQGGFSEIFESHWMGIPIAVKVIFDPNINEALLEEFNNEIEKLFILRHPYIIQLYGITDNEKNQKLFSIENRVTSNTLPTFIWTIKNDEVVPPENTLYMIEALKNKKVMHEYKIFKNGRHGMVLADDSAVRYGIREYKNKEVAKWLGLACNFIEKVIKNKK